MKKTNILTILPMLFLANYLSAMDVGDLAQVYTSNNLKPFDGRQKRKASEIKDGRKLKKNKNEYFEEEEEMGEFVTTGLLNWNSLPDELKLLILSLIINTRKALFAIDINDVKNLSALFKGYATLGLVNKDISNLSLDIKLFDLASIIAYLVKSKRCYLTKILDNAAKFGCINVMQLALSKGSLIENNSQLIGIASRSNHKEFCLRLIEAGIFEGATNLALVNAIYLHDIDRVRILVDAGKPTATLGTGATEIMMAAQIGDIGICTFLLNMNPQRINKKNKNGRTALHNSSFKGYKEIVSLLLDNNAVVDEKDNNGMTALYMASYYGHIEIVKLLLDNGASVDEKDSNGMTALQQASYRGHIEIVKFLLNSGAIVEEKDNNGFTTLYMASYYGHIEIVKLLLDNGAIVDEKNNNGQTTLSLAYQKGHTGIVQLLKEHLELSAINS